MLISSILTKFVNQGTELLFTVKYPANMYFVQSQQQKH